MTYNNIYYFNFNPVKKQLKIWCYHPGACTTTAPPTGAATAVGATTGVGCWTTPVGAATTPTGVATAGRPRGSINGPIVVAVPKQIGLNWVRICLQ